MKLSCKVIEDVLPMYYDGVCSDETAALVDAHLQNCPRCTKLLTDLNSVIEIPETPGDDLKPLIRIQTKWKRDKRTYVGRGICLALAALLLIAAVLSGIWYFSYGTYYYRLTEIMERPSPEDPFPTSVDYTLEKDGYRFDVALPMILSDSGFVRVMDGDGLVLFLYPQRNGAYSFWFFITDANNQSYSVHLKSDMRPDFDNYPFPVRSDAEKSHIEQLLTDCRDDIAAMLDAVETLWGIDLLEYAA